MLKRIARFIRDHDWFAVVVEVLVVVVGLLLAFQLDDWRRSIEAREQERVYVDRLISDVENDIPDIEYAIGLQSMRLELIEFLMKVAIDPQEAAGDPVIFLSAIDQAAFTYTPALTSHTFENLRSTGDLRLIHSDEVKSTLFEYYGFDESQRQFRPLELAREFRHIELAAGVLSQDQAIFIQDAEHIIAPAELESVRELETDVGEVLAAAERLQQRHELIAWFPQIRSLQLEQVGVHSARLERAQELLEVLRKYAASIAAN